MNRTCFRLIQHTIVLSFLLKTFITPAIAGEIPASLLRLGDGQYFSTTALVVDKIKRRLSVWSRSTDGMQKVAEYPSDLGKQIGPKSSRGDYRTPEGIYFLKTMMEGTELPYQQYGIRAFTTNYPNLFDIREGRTGNGIWLHAVPDTVSLERGSRGCVVLRNDSIKEVTQYIKLGATPLIISDTVALVDENKSRQESDHVVTFFESWKTAWQKKDIEKYIGFYDESFSSLGMSKAQWKAYKKELTERYEKIAVNFSDPVIYKHQGKVVIRALQSYNSDQHKDFGEKILYLVEKSPGDYKIFGEEWAPVTNAEALQATVNTTRSTANAN